MLVRVAVAGVFLSSGAVSREIDEDDDASFLEQPEEEVEEREDAEEDEAFEDEQEEDELEDEEEDASALLEEEAEDEDEKNDEEDEDELEDEEDEEGKPASKLVKTVRAAMGNGSNASALLEDEDEEAEIEEDEQDNEDEDEDEEKETEEDEQDDEDEGDDEEEDEEAAIPPNPKKIRKLAKAVAAAIGNHSHPGQHGQAAGCKVTTYSAGHCHGKAVKTYATFAAKGQQWKWGSGFQENQPVSARIQGSCKKVEFYDEDHNHEGYSDNMIKKTTGCFDFTYDLKKDLGGLKVFAK